MKNSNKEIAYLEIPKENIYLLKQNFIDFLRVNNYTCYQVRTKNPEELMNFSFIINSEQIEGRQCSEIKWELYPECFYDLLKRIDNDCNHIPLFIPQNRMANKDKVVDEDIIQDNNHGSYLKGYLHAAQKVINNGTNLIIYILWSVHDKFKWLH
ncbi:MAG: hypothetical protein BAJALOKI1v1_860017 [Promethearchaeota archaeon]|nr:MAG: hypothetical protein BAJALOKI1v1_860017 [Candidatus Lokiarchaeota archaeon]